VLLGAGCAGDRATIAFTVANASLSAGMEVLVFLASDGVDLTREGAAHWVQVRPFRPLDELMEEFVAAGGSVAACGSCVQYRSLDAALGHPKIQISGVSMLVAWLAEGATTISF
jgi:predicted peroxiredoxin